MSNIIQYDTNHVGVSDFNILNLTLTILQWVNFSKIIYLNNKDKNLLIDQTLA